jgi:hypothetical protein
LLGNACLNRLAKKQAGQEPLKELFLLVGIQINSQINCSSLPLHLPFSPPNVVASLSAPRATFTASFCGMARRAAEKSSLSDYCFHDAHWRPIVFRDSDYPKSGQRPRAVFL